MDHTKRLSQAYRALEGLSVGDAFGQKFFGPPIDALQRIERREVPSGTWQWTDDTAMARVLYEVLRIDREVVPDTVARQFAVEYVREPHRGYGRGAHTTLTAIAQGLPWEVAARAEFPGGSFGNGAAMRAPVIGAFYADQSDALHAAAVAASLPTHVHEEGIAGGIAVAAATAFAVRTAEQPWSPEGLFRATLEATPQGRVRDGIVRAFDLDVSAPKAAELLGSGQLVCAYDTVPFSIWCAARWGNDFAEAMWQTVSGLGDRDTTCAMVGGIVAGRVGEDGVPMLWRHSRERLWT